MSVCGEEQTPNNEREQVRSQKSAMGGLFWGCGGGAPNRRRPMGFWGRSSQPLEV